MAAEVTSISHPQRVLRYKATGWLDSSALFMDVMDVWVDDADQAGAYLINNITVFTFQRRRGINYPLSLSFIQSTA